MLLTYSLKFSKADSEEIEMEELIRTNFVKPHTEYGSYLKDKYGEKKEFSEINQEKRLHDIDFISLIYLSIKFIIMQVQFFIYLEITGPKNQKKNLLTKKISK